MADHLLARAIIEIGAQGVAGAKAEIADLEKTLAALGSVYARGKISVTEYAAQSAKLHGQIEALKQGVTGAEAAIQKYGSVSAAAAAMSGKAFQQAGSQGAYGLLILSQSIDDVRYGFSAIVNNLPQLGMALGSALGMGAEAGMKLGAAAGIAGVAINTLINHWGELVDLVGLGTTKTEAERMAELEKNTARTADETARLNDYKREQAEIESMLSGKSKQTRETGQAVQSAFDEGPGGKIAGALAAQMRRKMTQEQEAQVARLAHANPLQRSTAQEELRKQFEDALDAEAAEMAKQLMLDAKRGDATGARARAELKSKVERAPGAFPPGFLKDIEEADPAERKKQAAIEAQGERNKEAIDKRMKEVEAQEGFEAEGRKNTREYLRKQREKQDQSATRYVGAMEGGAVGRELLRKPDLDDTQLEDRIKTAMAKAGVGAEEIGELTPLIAKKLREKLDKDIAARALDRGITAEEARVQLSKEAEKQARDERIKDAGPKAEVMSDKQYLDRLLTAGVSKADAIPKDQLEAAKATNKKLDEIKVVLAKDRKGDAVARFAAGKVHR